MCNQVLPTLSEVTTQEEASSKEGEDKKENGAAAVGAPKADAQLEILKLLAEMSTYCGPMENMETSVGRVFDKLIVSWAGVDNPWYLLYKSWDIDYWILDESKYAGVLSHSAESLI